MLSCKTHRNYKCQRPPRSECERCWLVWLIAETVRLGARITNINDRLERIEAPDWI